MKTLLVINNRIGVAPLGTSLVALMVLALALVISTRAAAAATQSDNRVTEPAWRAVYYNNTTLSGQPVFYRDETSLDHNWGAGSPDASVSSDNFSARWDRIVELQAGTYRFSITGDDGVRVFLNDELILNGWWDHGPRTFTVERPVAAGKHAVRVEFYERNGSAQVKFALDTVSSTPGPTPVPPPPTTPTYPAQPVPADAAWKGEYFNNTKLEGGPVLVRNDGEINFNWGMGSPDASVSADGFSVRWTRNVHFAGGVWRFKTTTDDGVRLYIDGNLVIDQWRLQDAVTHETKVSLAEGVHTIRMEYFEQGDRASARLRWELATSLSPVGNLITCVPPNPPNYAWIRVYRRDGNGNWYRAIPRGVGSVNPSGFLKIDGLPVDVAKYGGTGEPYWIEQWVDGSVTRSVGNTDRGEAEFRIRPGADNYTPWQCGR